MSARPKLALVGKDRGGRREPIPGLRADRGYSVVYRPGEPNRCPGCGSRAWRVGRSMAECAGCATALPISEDGRGE